MKTKIFRLKPPRIAMVLVIVSAIFYYFVPPFHYSAWYCLLCGLVPAALGFLLMIWAWAEFKRKSNPICPTERPTSFITSGPFRFTRNPMYLGIAVMLFAPALWLGAPVFLIAPVAFLAVVATIFVPFEENRLTEEYGTEFLSYMSRVRRWI